MTEYEEAGNKYAYLLQPLKDLDRNFAIDIVTLLDEYANQLEAMANEEQFEIDNAHRFNFAEAAMLIQGSVCVFGKKVDHVFAQACNFMETLKTTKKPKKVVNEDDEGFENGFDDDDIAEQNERMALSDPCALQDFRTLKSANISTLAMKHKSSSISTISVMPMSLMPLADFEKCNVPIYSHKKSKDIIGKKDDFKINTGYMGPRGALLLDLLNAQILDEFASDQFMQLGMHMDDEEEEKKGAEGDADSGRGSPDADIDADAMNEIDIPDYDGGRPSNVIERCRRGTGEHLAIGRPSTVLKDDDMGCDAASDFGGDDDFNDSILQQKADPWDACGEFEPDPFQDLYMDSYEELKWKRHPVKVISCSTKSIAMVEKRKKQEKKITVKERTMQTIQYINEHFYMKSHKERLNLNKGDDWETDALFRYIVQQQKERAIVKKQKNAALKEKAKNKIARQLEEEEDILGGAYDDDDDEEPLPTKDIASTQAAGSQPRVLFQDIDDDELRNSMNIPSLYIGKQPTTANINDHGNDAHIPLDDNRPTSDMTTEEILNFYMHKYWTSAQEATSRLAVRVQEWEERMVPLLEEEETRKEFDIHEYGSYALDLFGKDGETKDFSELVVSKSFYEISRYFLASLMLANTYNLKIEDNQQLGLGMETNTMRATLLKRDRHHEVFNQDGAL